MMGRKLTVWAVLAGMALSGCASTPEARARQRDFEDTVGTVVVGGLAIAAVVALALLDDDDGHHHDHGGRQHR